jgi:hypothetical protein
MHQRNFCHGCFGKLKNEFLMHDFFTKNNKFSFQCKPKDQEKKTNINIQKPPTKIRTACSLKFSIRKIMH